MTETGASRGFGKALRIRTRREFLSTQRRGHSARSAHFVVVWTERPQHAFSRMGVTVSRRVGNAVRRNRVKRRVREFFRIALRDLPAPRDYVFIARSGADVLSQSEVARELRGAIR